MNQLQHIEWRTWVIVASAITVVSCGGGGGGGSSGVPATPLATTISSDFCAIQPAKSTYIVATELPCSTVTAEPFRTQLRELYSTVGTYNMSRVFLGCDMQRATIPTDLSAYDGIILFNISGQNITTSINTVSAKPFVVMTDMDNGGGSNIQVTLATAVPRSNVAYSHVIYSSGGSNVALSNAIRGDTAYFKSCAGSGGSNFRVNSTFATQGVLIIVP